jgi:hypothetical protein
MFHRRASLSVRVRVLLGAAIVAAIALTTGISSARASADPVVANWVNDPANWTRIQSFVNGSPTYATSEAAVAAGTDGASIEDLFYLVRAQAAVVPTTEELVAYGFWNIPLYGTAFAGGFVVGTALNKWLHISSGIASLFDSRTVAPSYLSECDWRSNFSPPNNWRLMCWATPNDYGWSTTSFPDPDCSTQWHTCFNPVTGAPNDEGTWNMMSSVARMVDHGTIQGFLDSSGNPRFRRVMSTADVAATFHHDGPLEAYTNQPKVTNVPIGSPLNVAADSTPANNVRTTILSDPEAAQGLTHVVVTDDPRPGDPSVPAPGQGCTSTTDNPHWSDGGQTVDAKGRVTCTYTGYVAASMYLWKCMSHPTQNQFLLDTGAYGCVRVAANIGQTIPVVVGEPATLYVPQEGILVDQEPGYWIATTSGADVLQSYSQDAWGYSEEGGWVYLP